MSIVDPSYIELLQLVFRPLSEEFEYPWNVIRSCFWGMLPIALMSFVTGMALDPTPEYIKAKNLFSDIAIISSVLALAIYGGCGWQAYKIHQAREASKSERVRKFRD